MGNCFALDSDPVGYFSVLDSFPMGNCFPMGSDPVGYFSPLGSDPVGTGTIAPFAILVNTFLDYFSRQNLFHFFPNLDPLP